MNSLASRLRKPEYFYRPSQLARRAVALLAPRRSVAIVRLPWGHTLEVDPRETVGRAIARLGVYDLPVSEALWRLLAPGDRALDLGANLGYATSLMAARVGSGGAVLAFEPHPGNFARLERNLARWPVSSVRAYPVALSDRAGVAALVVPPEFNENHGLPRLARAGETGAMEVPTERLDAFTGAGDFAVMKVDVEGHEAEALAGAGDLIASRRIRHLIFEELDPASGVVSRQLQAAGFTVWRLGMEFRGPLLLPLAPRRGQRAWLPQSCLATCDPAAAQRAFAPRGWQVLRARAQMS